MIKAVLQEGALWGRISHRLERVDASHGAQGCQ